MDERLYHFAPYLIINLVSFIFSNEESGKEEVKAKNDIKVKGPPPVSFFQLVCFEFGTGFINKLIICIHYTVF